MVFLMTSRQVGLILSPGKNMCRFCETCHYSITLVIIYYPYQGKLQRMQKVKKNRTRTQAANKQECKQKKRNKRRMQKAKEINQFI